MDAPEGLYPMSYCNDTIYSNWNDNNNNNNLTESSIIENLSKDMKNENIYENKIVSIKSELLESINDSFAVEVDKDTMKDEIKEINDTIQLFDSIFKKIQNQSMVVLEKEKEYKDKINETRKDIEKIETFSQFLKEINKKFPDNDEIDSISNDICKLSEKINEDNTCLTSKNKYQKELYLLNEYQNLLKKINNGNVGNTCSLCLQNPVNKFFNPCGHTACDNCIEKLYEKAGNPYNVNCFLCRKKVNSNHPIYFI